MSAFYKELSSCLLVSNSSLLSCIYSIILRLSVDLSGSSININTQTYIMLKRHIATLGPSASGVSSARKIVKSDIMEIKKPVQRIDFIVRLTASTALFSSINVVSFFLLRTMRKALLKSFIRPVEIRNGTHIISRRISVGKSIKYRNTEDCPHNPALQKTMVRITAMNEINYIKISSLFFLDIML